MSDGVPSGFVCKDGVFLCPFFHVWRVHWGVRVCDYLVVGVPACVVAGFYPDLTVTLEHWLNPDVPLARWRGDGAVRVVGSGICRHFCRSDIISELGLVPSVVKRGCFFGGVECVHSDVVGFGACVGCSRFVR
jgi:hypothetical protein